MPFDQATTLETKPNIAPRISGDRQVSSQPRILAIVTQGTNSSDAERLRMLLSCLPYLMFSFEREHKLRSFVALLKHIVRERSELVVMEGTGLAGGLALILGWLFKRTRYIVSSGDAIGPFVRKFHPLIGLAFSAYERLLYKYCSGFIGWTPYLVGRALTFGAPKAMTAAGWAPFEKSDAELQAARKRIRNELGIPDNHLVIGLAGSLGWNKRVGYCYGYELVKAALATNRPDVHVLIVGDGDGRTMLEQLSGAELGKRIHFTGRVSRGEVPDYLAAMDAASLPQSIDQVGSFRYTTKISEYFSVGLPIVTGHLPLAYDFPTECFWRMPGKTPWGKEYVYGLAAWMKDLMIEEVVCKRERMPHSLTAFDRARQIGAVTEFIYDLLSEDFSATQQIAQLTTT